MQQLTDVELMSACDTVEASLRVNFPKDIVSVNYNHPNTILIGLSASNYDTIKMHVNTHVRVDERVMFVYKNYGYDRIEIQVGRVKGWFFD